MENIHFDQNCIKSLEFLANEGYKDKTLQEIVTFLQKQATTKLHNFHESKEEDYKNIAITSLLSYKNTNQSFKDLASIQAQHIQEIQKEPEQIDIKTIEKKFSDVYNHMLVEVKKANDEINRLNIKIKSLEEESILDPLTKVFNKRALINYLQDVCSKEKIYHQMHLLILDLDDFKQINDKYGHIAGDKILIYTAQILKKLLRDGDKIFRFGGEEFVIILNRINKENAIKIAQRILQYISNNNLIYNGDSIKITTSIGITTLTENDTPDSFLNRADEALYEAKKQGKNRLIVK